MSPFEMDRGGWFGGLVDEELVPAEAGVALTALRVEDSQRRSTTRRPISVACDQRLRSLAHDVATEPDPRAANELQAEAGRSGHGTRQVAGETGWLQHDEERLRAPGQGGQTVEPIGKASRAVRGGDAAAGQVQDDQVHRASGKQRSTDGQPFIERLRGDDHQPFEADAPGDSLDRIKASSEIDPGHDRAGRLGLCGEPEDEGGPTARPITADRNACRTWQAARSQDRVEVRESSPDDPVTWVRCGFRPWRWIGQGRLARSQSEGAFGKPRSCRSPASLEARHGCHHICRECRHPFKIEHLFYRINPALVRGNTAVGVASQGRSNQISSD